MSRALVVAANNAALASCVVWAVVLGQPTTMNFTDGGEPLPYAPAAPQWSPDDAATFIGCRAWHEADGRGKDIPTSLVVITVDGTHRRMSLDEGWSRSTDDNRANDVWTIGGCWS